MSIFIIKIIACVTMVLDHIRYVFPQINNLLIMCLGRISFPLFAFLITEGYIHTRNLKSYYKRLIIFAIISQIPFMLFRILVGEYLLLNILFTLLLGLLTITVYEKINNKFFSIPICLMLILGGEILNVDYGWFGVATVFVFYIFKNNKFLEMISFSFLTLVYYWLVGILKYITIPIIMLYIFTILPLFFIFAYNGKLGRRMKYFFYWFYPIHMIVLYFIKFII